MTKINAVVLRNTRKYRLRVGVRYTKLRDNIEKAKAYTVGLDEQGTLLFKQEESIEIALRKACKHEGLKVMQNGKNIDYNVVGDYILYTDGSKMMRMKV